MSEEPESNTTTGWAFGDHYPMSCPWCSGVTGAVYHYDGICPKVMAIEYFPNGAVKRVEFWDGPESLDSGKLRDRIRIIIHEEIGKGQI